MQEATLEPIARMDKLIFTYLPDYARFIRENALVEYIRYQLKGAKELNTPLLKIFEGHSDEQIIEASIPGHTEFLIAAEKNELSALLNASIKKWIKGKHSFYKRGTKQSIVFIY